MTGGEDVAAEETPRRAPAFRVVATVLGALLVVLTLPFAVIATESDDPTQAIHRFHATGGAVPSLILAAALFVLAWRPAAVAAMQLFVAGAIVSLLVGLVAGDLFTGLLFLGVVLAAILLALYPSRADVWRTGGPRSWLLAVAVVAFVPAIAYALAEAKLQRHGTSLDPHADMHHYSGAAVAAVSLPATVLVAAIGRAAWAIVGWIGAAALVLFGVSGLAFSDYVSAPDPAWCWASVATGFVVFALTEFEARRMPGGRTA
jgi:fucose 4-O-acetylase-like acetyltransferase